MSSTNAALSKASIYAIYQIWKTEALEFECFSSDANLCKVSNKRCLLVAFSGVSSSYPHDSIVPCSQVCPMKVDNGTIERILHAVKATRPRRITQHHKLLNLQFHC